MEVNLAKLYQLVQRLGGLKQVIEKKRWIKVAEEMRLTRTPKADKKIDQIYVKYILPYDTLSNSKYLSNKLIGSTVALLSNYCDSTTDVVLIYFI